MKKYAVQLALLTVLVLFGITPAMAQGQNLLTNPGFEDPFSTLENSSQLRVAHGWTPWHVPAAAGAPSWQNERPTYLPAAPDTDRILSGNNAQQYFSFYATHDGGVYQRVTGITSGAQLRFSINAYIWSSNLNDLDVSDGDGDVFGRAGIDPTGGTDAKSANIIWSPNVELYDAYNAYVVTATASGTAVTVFFETTVGSPVQTYIYLDDASLTVAGSTTPPTPTIQSAPTSTNTNVPPPTATVSQATPDDGGIRPTATNTLAPTNTVPPSNTPVPTNTVPPSNTPVPSNTPIPSETPVPSNTPEPSPTPENNVPPTATTAPTGGNDGSPISDDFPGTIIHVVRRGETVGGLATLYGSTVDVIVEANGLNEFAFIREGQSLIVPVRIAAPVTATPSSTPPGSVNPTQAPGTGGPIGSTVYIVQPGDTLIAIAQRYNTTVAALAQLNGIVNQNRIDVGQRLVVPATGGPTTPATSPAPATQVVPAPTAARPTTHLVLYGENLFRISIRYNVPLQRLVEANNIQNPNLIYAGQVLNIP